MDSGWERVDHDHSSQNDASEDAGASPSTDENSKLTESTALKPEHLRAPKPGTLQQDTVEEDETSATAAASSSSSTSTSPVDENARREKDSERRTILVSLMSSTGTFESALLVMILALSAGCLACSLSRLRTDAALARALTRLAGDPAHHDKTAAQLPHRVERPECLGWRALERAAGVHADRDRVVVDGRAGAAPSRTASPSASRTTCSSWLDTARPSSHPPRAYGFAAPAPAWSWSWWSWDGDDARGGYGRRHRAPSRRRARERFELHPIDRPQNGGGARDGGGSRGGGAHRSSAQPARWVATDAELHAALRAIDAAAAHAAAARADQPAALADALARAVRASGAAAAARADEPAALADELATLRARETAAAAQFVPTAGRPRARRTAARANNAAAVADHRAARRAPSSTWRGSAVAAAARASPWWAALLTDTATARSISPRELVSLSANDATVALLLSSTPRDDRGVEDHRNVDTVTPETIGDAPSSRRHPDEDFKRDMADLDAARGCHRRCHEAKKAGEPNDAHRHHQPAHAASSAPASDTHCLQRPTQADLSPATSKNRRLHQPTQAVSSAPTSDAHREQQPAQTVSSASVSDACRHHQPAHAVSSAPASDAYRQHRNTIDTAEEDAAAEATTKQARTAAAPAWREQRHDKAGRAEVAAADRGPDKTSAVPPTTPPDPAEGGSARVAAAVLDETKAREPTTADPRVATGARQPRPVVRKLRSLTIKQLRAMLASLGKECKTCLEKDDLVAHVLSAIEGPQV